VATVGPPALDDQRETIAFLSRPGSYGTGIDRVQIIETHVSLVFLAGDRAYKLKRAVKLPYLDFSTAERRCEACESELMLNRRTAPALYLKVYGLGRDQTGAVCFSDKGPAFDWVVVMRRFDQALLFDALAKTGGLTEQIMDSLADHIAAFHEAAEKRFDNGGPAAISEIAETNHRVLMMAKEIGLHPARVEGIGEKWCRSIESVAGLLDKRRMAGKVRRCHGDLHLRNICLLDGKPTLFDCLEFSDALASVDVLYDLAFLLMDLEFRGLGHLANRVLNRYLDRTGEDEALAAMPLFLSLRAGIRAHVTATTAARAGRSESATEAAAEARRYLDLAHLLLEPRRRQLVAIGGLSGSGKSTLAASLAPELGLRPGARVLRSDVTRKLLLGVAPETRLPADAYTPEITDRVYDALRRKAAAALAAGYSVIVDAVSLQPAERRSFTEIARTAGVPFSGLWLEADAGVMTQRLQERRGDASDATPEILELQLHHDPGPLDWVRLDAGGGSEQSLALARRILALS